MEFTTLTTPTPFLSSHVSHKLKRSNANAPTAAVLLMHRMASSSSSSSPASASKWEAERLVGKSRNPEAGVGASSLDVAHSRFPFSIVWTPLPAITSCLPVVGHLGIADSRGVIYDFGGPYHISVDDFSFSRPYLYLQLDPRRIPAPASSQDEFGTEVRIRQWDAAVDAGAEDFSRRMHNICCQNCHHHVAACLNEMRYDGRSDWSMLGVGALIILKGKWISPAHALCVWLPFLLVCALVVGLSVWRR